MLENILLAIKEQPAYVAIVATLILAIFRQVPSKLGFWNMLSSYGIIIILVIILILQTQGQINQINETNEMKVRIKHLEKIIEDNNLTVKDPKVQAEFESKIQQIEAWKKIKLLPLF